MTPPYARLTRDRKKKQGGKVGVSCVLVVMRLRSSHKGTLGYTKPTRRRSQREGGLSLRQGRGWREREREWKRVEGGDSYELSRTRKAATLDGPHPFDPFASGRSLRLRHLRSGLGPACSSPQALSSDDTAEA